MTFDKINEHFGKLLAELSDENEVYKLIVANKLFIKDGLELLEKFQKLINETYDGQLEQVNFVESDATAQVIVKFSNFKLYPLYVISSNLKLRNSFKYCTL